MAPKFGENVAWHPACFQCTTCAELLVDLTYCVHEEQLYCERHYAEQLKPRCSACDEVSLISYPFQPLDGLTLHTIGSSIARNLKTKTKTGIFSWHESHARFSTTQFIRLLLFCLFVTGSPSRRRFPLREWISLSFRLLLPLFFPTRIGLYRLIERASWPAEGLNVQTLASKDVLKSLQLPHSLLLYVPEVWRRHSGSPSKDKFTPFNTWVGGGEQHAKKSKRGQRFSFQQVCQRGQDFLFSSDSLPDVSRVCLLATFGKTINMKTKKC